MDKFILIENDSPLLKIPKELSEDQIVKFDIIRFKLEILQDFYNIMFQVIDEGINEINKPNNLRILNYAWLIVENAHILKNLSKKFFPNYKFHNTELWENIKFLRHTNQHVDNRIELFERLNVPYFGYISLDYIDKESNEKMSYINDVGIKLSRPLEFNTPNEISQIIDSYKNIKAVSLNSIIKKPVFKKGNKKPQDFIEEPRTIEFLTLFYELSMFNIYLNDIIYRTMDKHNLELYDWSKRKDISVFIKYNDLK